MDIGGLLSYGADGPAAFRHSAKFVRDILQGKQPKDLPIEQSTKFELAIQSKNREDHRRHNSGDFFCNAPMSCSNEVFHYQ